VTPPPRVPEPPDDDCLFDPSLPKCAPIDGKCPDGFLMNENEQCFPDKPCPTGFEKRDEDETGKCYPIEPTPTPTPTLTPTPTPTPMPAFSITDDSLQVSTNKKVYNLGEDVTITVKNNGNETVWLPNGALGIGIRNLDTGKTYAILATQALVSLEPGESKSTGWNQKDGEGEGEQATPGNYRAGVGSRPFTDFKIQGPAIDVNVVIINNIHNQIRNYYITTSPLPSCTTTQDKTIPLGPGTMANNGIRLLAVFEPCRLVDGSAILNLPSGNNLKLLAVDLEGSANNVEVHKAVIIEPQGNQGVTNDQILYNVGFSGTVTTENLHV
jgi:hypothetical protein